MNLQYFKRRQIILFMLFLSAFTIPGCGKKPVNLSPPEKTQSAYPQNYPKSEEIPGKGMQFSDLPPPEEAE